MADVLNKGNLLPEVLVTEMFDKVKGKSSLAKLSRAEPIPFNGLREFTFSMDKEVDIVAESGAKTKGGVTIAPITVVPIKMEYGARVSDEFIFGADEVKLQYLKNFTDGFYKKIARGIDIAAFHGFNPRTGSASTVVGNNCFGKAVSQIVTHSAGTADADIEAAIALVQGSECDVTGMALSPTERSELAKLTLASGQKMYPELAWGSNPGVINGLAVDVNSTVSFGSSGVLALLGDFESSFRWGFARELPIEVIEYGNPDNDAVLGDLKGHNQVYLRGEAYVGWGILNPAAFAVVKSGG